MKDKTVVVTAAANGIGREAVLRFCGLGAKVVVSDRDAGGARTVAEEAVAQGGTAFAIGCDVTSDEDMERLAGFAFEKLGHVDVLLNHAGASAGGRIALIPIEDWRLVYDVNVLGIARALKHFLPHMARRRSGLIINTSSSLGLFPEIPFSLPYITTKAGVIGLSEALGLYCRPLGIRVMALVPDITKTQFHYSGRKTGISPEKTKGMLPLSQEQLPSDVIDALMASIDKGQFIACNVPDFDDLLVRKAADRGEPAYRVYAQVENRVEQVVLDVSG